jgi:hypothetical protein
MVVEPSVLTVPAEMGVAAELEVVGALSEGSERS